MQVAPRLYVNNEASALVPYEGDGAARRPFWAPEVTLISRADCAFRRLRLADASAQGYAALRLQALNEARRGHDAVYIRPGQTGRWANVWTFKTPIPLRGKSVPETELQTPGGNGLRLTQGLSGVEGQFWHDKILLASRWWPHPPKAHQWASFLQGLDQAALGIDAAKLRADIPPLSRPALNEPIAIISSQSFKSGALSPQTLLKPSRMALAAIALTMISGTYLGAQFINAKISLSKTQNQVATLSEHTSVIMQDRQAALGNLAAIRDFDVLGSRIILLSAWDQLASALEGESVIFQSFNYLNEEIEIKIQGRFALSAADIVTKVESLPAFHDVTYTLGRGEESTLKAKLVNDSVAAKGSGS